jgi:hypothetical protein
VPIEPGMAQLRQSSVQAVLQQTPSTQKPVAQALPLVQVIPPERTQAPVASQVPRHRPGSSAETMGAQVPSLPGWLQLRQVPVQLLSQQTRSTHEPLAHSLE